MRSSRGFAYLALVLAVSANQIGLASEVLTKAETKHAISEIRSAYAAFNRGDIEAAVSMLDANVEWSEPVEFPGGGEFHGIDQAKRYLSQSRAGADRVISEPEQFIPAGDKIVVFVRARVLPKGTDSWQEIRLADVYTFHHDKATALHAFADRKEALRWAQHE